MELEYVILICASIFMGVNYGQIMNEATTSFDSTTESSTTIEFTTEASDIDECTTFQLEYRNECDDMATCTNNFGSYSCACNSGYQGNGMDENCLNINECVNGTDSCDSDAVCADTAGSYTCTCNAGYSGDGMTCTDIDECFIKSDNCTEGEKCINAIGGFTCVCQTNYFQIDGVCTASASRSLVVVFTEILDKSAVDNLVVVDTEANRIALAGDVFTLINSSSTVGPDLLGVAVTTMTNVTNGTSVTFLVDLVASTTLTDAQVAQAFVDGLTGASNDTVAPNSAIEAGSTPTVTLPDINQCEAGTDDCYALNYAQCVYESSNVFSCATCLSGYAAPSVVGDACTEIFPCENITVSQACADQGFVDCVHDGPGQSHCENCLAGWTMVGNICERLRKFQGSATLFEYGIGAAVFTEDLTNSSSPVFIALAEDICTFLSASTGASICQILGFTNGSIIFDYILLFPATTNSTASSLDVTIVAADQITTELALTPGSVVVVDISAFCEFSSCLNGATCSIDNSNQIVCTCATGYTGSDCGTAVTTVAPTVPPSGLSVGAIVAIVLGCVVAFIIIVVLIVVLIVKCSASSKVGVREQEPFGEQLPLASRREANT